MTTITPLSEVGRIPLPGDNVAIATRKIAAGTNIEIDNEIYELDFTILEGHRFAIEPIGSGEALLSWNLPFGIATKPIEPGMYVCNLSTLEALGERAITFELPADPNFRDHIEPYEIDNESFVSGEPTERYPHEHAFLGYRRSGARGVGTRNMIVLLGTSSRTGSFVKQLEERMKRVADGYENIDAIVAVAHTEGGNDSPNNRQLMLRTLAGFMVHPNIGAVLAVDYGLEPINNSLVQTYMAETGYALDQVPHHFHSITNGFQDSMEQCELIVRGWLEEVNQTPRTKESVANLKIALQCGGSDAFSGISGNPLASWVAREVIRYGGSANLAETDELIGAEPYMLQRVRDLPTARKFLATIERFKERVSWHGHTAEGNPSGGNKFRGLYNIVLKSIGAAMKRHPEVRLDYVIDYGEPMAEPGYYFMDSPGNDLESIAGQVAAGCNVIFFVTGNGSITNFPFVPTLKFITTSRRHRLLSQDMDINAGAYLDGMSMDDLGEETFQTTVAMAAGQQSLGEKAGHAQTQIWRDWRQTSADNLNVLLSAPAPTGAPIPVQTVDAPTTNVRFSMIQGTKGPVMEEIGLILPTSLCSGQIAAMTANHFNQKGLAEAVGISRFVALTHTEGCGASSGTSEELYARTMVSYIAHPLIKHCLLLEHGCEKTHNDYMRNAVTELGVDADTLGWASVQLDGGIEKAIAKMETWFLANGFTKTSQRVDVGPEALSIALLTAGPVSDSVAQSFAQLTKLVVAAGGTVVAPESTSLLSNKAFRHSVLTTDTVMPTLAYGERATSSGFHLMDSPTSHWVEMTSGLGAAGVQLVVAHIGEHPIQSHPLLPVLQVTADEQIEQRYGSDLDLVLGGEGSGWHEQILQLMANVANGTVQPKLHKQGNIDFQITRGLLGVSM